jgi:hypothetical protein
MPTKTALGVRKEYLIRCSMLQEEGSIKRSDALGESDVQKVKDFYIQPEISTTLPDTKQVKDGKSRHIYQRL